MPKTGATPGKLLLVGGLVAVLGWLLFSPAESEVEETSEVLSEAPRRRPRARPPAPAPFQRPATPLAEVLRFDPFAPLRLPTSDTAQEVAAARTAETNAADATPDTGSQRELTPEEEMTGQSFTPPIDRLAGWRSLRVEAIFDTGRGKAALIGARTVREGEVIDGVRVVKIASDGVLVEECPSDELPD